MDAVTLSNKLVNEMAQANFSPLKLDTSANKDDIKKLGIAIESLPTTLFLKPNGSLIKKIKGYVKPEKFLHEMKNIHAVYEGKVVIVKEEVKEEVKEKTPATKLEWLTSIEKGKKEAKKQNKTLLVKFGATW